MRFNVFRVWLSVIIFLSWAYVCNAQQNSSNKKPESKPDSVQVMALGKVIFANTCKACHGNPAFPKASSLEAMVNMQPRAIFNTLDNVK